MTRASEAYDYIIAGAGAAGLSLAWHMMQDGLDGEGKRILLVDRQLDPENDKTWCFWQAGIPPFEPLLRQSWKEARIRFNHTGLKAEMDRYRYHCISSGTFRRQILKELRNHSAFELLEEPITRLESREGRGVLITEKGRYEAEYIFQSCFTPDRIKQSSPHYPLLQHFLGWEVEAGRPVFDKDAITLMDFDEGFKDGVAFMYVLPWSESKALLEYTVFSSEVLPPSFYQEKIELYLNNQHGLRVIDYATTRTEYGEIPMQDLPHVPWYDNHERVMNIGMAGGLTKPSTGYTFQRIQRHTRQIVCSLQQGERPAPPPRSKPRFRAYDLWLLHIMYHDPESALDIFRALFTANELDEIFKFLGEQTSPAEDLRIMSSVPYLPFFKAIWNTKDRLLQL